jgi:putative transposase
MPRRRRFWDRHACYHITHRCHERRYLLRFAKYRDMYRKYLFTATQRFNVSVLAYVVTSNHVHVLLATGDRGRPQVSEALQHVHGETAQHYNIARKREGSFWSNRFHATHVQSGAHLRRCLFYIDMNMVRAKVVNHPLQWQHCSAYELASSRQRYRIVDRQRLLERLEISDWDAYRRWYDHCLNEIMRRELFRECQPFWSSSLAVGDAEWIGRTAEMSGMKRYDRVDANETWLENVKSFFLRAQNIS